MRLIYECLLGLTFLGYLPKAFLKKRLPHAGWSMRLGRYPAAVRAAFGAGGAIWVHAVSVGEVMAARPVIEELARRWPDEPIVLSTVTPAGFGVASQWLAPRGTAIYGPLDFRPCVRRAVDAIQPRALILLESELWPGLIGELHARRVPIIVVNGRISTRAFPRYRAVRRLLQPWIGWVDAFLMQTEVDAQRVLAMGAPADRVHVMGSLKWDASRIGHPDPAEVAALRTRLGLDGQQVLVAGSTHRGEEEALLQAVRGIRGQLDTIRLVLAPRHVERVAEVEAMVSRSGLTVRRASSVERPGPWDVLLIDSMGQLPRYYALASLVFVGGSLIPHGGQNPIEPASLGKPIVFGPHMDNFAEIVQQLVSADAARRLPDATALTAALLELLTNQAGTAAMGERARRLTEQARGVAGRTVQRLAPWLDGAPAGGARASAPIHSSSI